MKRLIACSLFLLLGVATLQAKSPWGGDASIDPAASHTAVDDPLTILKKLTSGLPLNVYFTFEDQIEKIGVEQNAQDLKEVANYWFEATAQAIKQYGNPGQFPQALKRLSHPVNIQVVRKEDGADLRVFVVSSYKTLENKCQAAACFVPSKGKSGELVIPSVNLADAEGIGAEEYVLILAHEFGHVLGLTDQYGSFENSHAQYRSTDAGYSLMAMQEMSCDDADGLINLIDIIYGTEPARAGGWSSLCGTKDVYINGQVKGTGKYSIDFFNGEPIAYLYTYENGKVVKEQKLPFVAADPFVRVADKQVLEKDLRGRPLHATGPVGEDIYYLYHFNRRFRLVTKDGKALMAEAFEKQYNENGKPVSWSGEKHVLSVDGHKATLVFNMLKSVGGEVGYIERDANAGDSDEEYIFVIGYGIDDHGKIGPAMEIDGQLPSKEQVQKLSTQTYNWGKAQLQQLGFGVKSNQKARAPQRSSQQRVATAQPTKPKAAQKDAQYVREQLSKQLRK